MTNHRSRMSDLKSLGVIVGITLAIGSTCWTVASWATTRVSADTAQEQHEELEARLDGKLQAALGGISTALSGLNQRIDNILQARAGHDRPRK